MSATTVGHVSSQGHNGLFAAGRPRRDGALRLLTICSFHRIVTDVSDVLYEAGFLPVIDAFVPSAE